MKCPACLGLGFFIDVAGRFTPCSMCFGAGEISCCDGPMPYNEEQHKGEEDDKTYPEPGSIPGFLPDKGSE